MAAQKKTVNNRRQYLGIILAVISIILSLVVKIDGLSTQAMHILGVTCATLFLQIFESFNLCVSCLLSSALLVMLGCVGGIGEAFSGYANHILYFTIASFAVSAAFQKSLLSRKALALFMKSGKLNVRKITLIFMVCSAALSSIMSNVAAVVIFLPYLEKFISFYKNEKDAKITSRCMNICLVVSAMMGGMITPAGSSVNLIGLDLMKKYAGITIRFIDWMAFGLPLAVIMVFVAFLVITKVYPPADLKTEELNEYLDYVRQTPKATGKDIYIGVLISLTLAAWIISSWIPAINITVVAVACMVLLFIPGYQILTWQEFSEVNSWNAFFVAGNHITLATVAVTTGLSTFFAGILFGGATAAPELLVLIKVAAITFLIMAIMPAAPAVATMLVPALITFSQVSGISAILLFMVSILCIPNIYLFPLDAPLVVAYDRKAFTMFELPRATVWIQLILIFVVPVLTELVYRLIY